MRNAAVDQHVHVERNAAFKLGELEQRFHQQFGIDGARARFDDQPNVFRQLVAHVGDQRQLLLVQQFGQPLDQPRLLHQPGDLRDDDLIGAASGLLDLPACAHAKRAAAGRVGLRDLFARIDDDSAGREIRPRHVFQQRLAARVRIVDQEQRGVAKFGGIMRRDRRRHADRDPLRAIGQQVRKCRRQNDRLLRQAIVVGAKVDRVFVKSVEQEPRNFGQPRFGVAIGRRVIAVDIAEVSLPVDQRIAR